MVKTTLYFVQHNSKCAMPAPFKYRSCAHVTSVDLGQAGPLSPGRHTHIDGNGLLSLAHLPDSIEALSQRLGPAALLDYANMTARPTAVAFGSSPSPLAALRAELGMSGPSADMEPGSLVALSTSLQPHGGHMQALGRLGQQLLGDLQEPGARTTGLARSKSGSSDPARERDGDVVPELVLSAARQRLMTMVADELTMGQVQLLMADYASFAAEHVDQQLLRRCVGP